MTYLAIVSGIMDDLPLALCKSLDAATSVARYAMTNPVESSPLQRALKLSPCDVSSLIAATVVTFDDNGDATARDQVALDLEEVQL